MADFDIDELDLDDIVDALGENVKEDTKHFEDVINLDGAVNREVYIGDIGYGLGQSVDGYIRFWNKYDDKHNIPIEKRKPIRIYIDSNGGSLTDTFTMIDSIKMSKTPVWTIVIGCAYSGGAFVLITGHKRFAYPHASIMFHEGQTQTGGDSHKFRNYADFYEKEMEQLKNHVLENTAIENDLYEKNKRDDWWLVPEEAIKLGVIDEITSTLI